nr:MAG TPA: hypothetical protein [Caudoviricetes sp.]
MLYPILGNVISYVGDINVTNKKTSEEVNCYLYMYALY